MSRVLVVSQYFPPDLTAAAFRMGELYKYLSKNGIETEVLTTTPHKIDLSLQTREHKAVKSGPIYRVPVKSASHLNQYFEFWFGSRKVPQKSYDWVIVSSPPMSVFQIAKRFLPASKIHLDIRDIWPDSAIAAGKFSEGMLYKYFKRYERKMYETVSSISAVSKPMAQYIRDIVPEKEVFVVYNGVPTEDLEKMARYRNGFGKGSNGRLKIAYAGNLGLLQGLEVVPDAMGLVKDLEVEFSFIGSGALEKTIRRKATEQRNISFFSPMARRELIPFLAQEADVLFINLKRDWILEKTIPSKLFDYLLLGKPIIAGIKGEGKEILDETGATVFFEQDSPVSLAEAIKKMHRDYPVYAKNASSKMPDIIKRYEREKQFSAILERVTR